MRKLGLTLSLLWCAWLGGCSDSVVPATQVVVAIDADSEVAATLQRITAQIFSPDAESGDEPSDAREFELTAPGRSAAAGQLALPISFGVAKGKSASFLLVVQGFAGGSDAVIEYKALATFRKQETLLLSVHLASRCYDRAAACSALDVSCDASSASGRCAPVEEADTRPIQPGDELDAGEEPLDGGADRDDDAQSADDGAMSDAALDAAPADDAGPPTEGGMDAALDAGDATADAAQPDATGSLPDAGVTLGGPCAAQGTFACVGAAQAKRLVCDGTWSAAVDCGTGANCDSRNGSCVSIAPECVGKAPNDTVCMESAALVCGPDLVTVSLMPVTGGVCGAECTPDATQCSGAIPQTCDANGRWQSGSVTVGKCNAVCTPTMQDCNGTTPRTCTPSGQWMDGPVTLNMCGAVCKPKSMRCDLINSAGQECKSDGTWGTNGSSVVCNCTEANRYTRVDQNLVLDTKTNLTWDFYVRVATWDGATAACAGRGMRLPSIAEWTALTPANTSFDFCKTNAVPVDLAGLPTTSSDFPFWVNSTFGTCCGNVMRFFAATGSTPGNISSTDRDKTQPMSYRCVK